MKYDEFIKRKKAEYGEKFSDAALAPHFIPYFNSGERIEIEYAGEKKRGYVGVTTGWRPTFLLMLRSNSMGSIYTLSSGDRILKVIPGKKRR